MSEKLIPFRSIARAGREILWSFCVRDASFLSDSWKENVQNINVCVRFCSDLRSGDLCKLEKYLIWLLQSDVQA